MKKSYVISIVLASILLGGLIYRYTDRYRHTSMTADEMFEHQHGQDMKNKEQEEKSTSISTKQVLQVVNPDPINTGIVNYYSGNFGYMAYPNDRTDAPGVIIIHEWRGLNDNIKDIADILAMNGYRVLAVDLYEGKVAQDMDQAMNLSRSLNQTIATQHLLSGEQYLRQFTTKVASLGRCLGGKQSLELSIASKTLNGTIIYYGRLTDNPQILSGINAPILGIFAENDKGIPPSQVQAFEKTLDQLGITEKSIYIYSGTDHAFANPTGNNYNEKATLDAREKTLQFLKRVLM